MALDTVRSLKLEAPSEGGTQTDTQITETNTLQDALAAAGFFIDGPTVTAADKTTFLDRTAAGLRLSDATTTQQLSNLVGASRTAGQYHGSLPDIVHWLSDGPGDGQASGAALVVNLTGPLVSSRVWYASSALTTKLFSETRTYPAGSPLPSAIAYTLFASNVAIRTVTDAITYSGPIETGRTRTWA